MLTAGLDSLKRSRLLYADIIAVPRSSGSIATVPIRPCSMMRVRCRSDYVDSLDGVSSWWLLLIPMLDACNRPDKTSRGSERVTSTANSSIAYLQYTSGSTLTPKGHVTHANVLGT